MKTLFEGKVGVFLVLLLGTLLVLVWLDYLDRDFSYHDILVESHGLAFDLLVFGAVITYYEIKKHKEEKTVSQANEREASIKRYKEEISDYRFWKSDESYYRTRGLIKRLVDLDVTELDLSHCYLKGEFSFSTYDRMIGWRFSAADLEGAFFLQSNMSNSHFYLTNLKNATFTTVNLDGSAFDDSNLLNTKFNNCNLDNTSFRDAVISDINWFETLEAAGNKGVEDLREKYKLETYVELNNDTYNKPKLYRLIRKVEFSLY